MRIGNRLLNMLILLTVIIATCQAVDFEISNHDGGTVWIGIQGNSGKPTLENGGFALNSGQSRTIQSPDDWAGRFWARTWCDDQTKHCLTGDCGNKLECGGAGGQPPVTLVEIALKQYAGLDYYDVSLVDGFNIIVTIEPVNGQGDNGAHSCKQSSCTAHINNDCPDPLKQNSPHGVIACKNDNQHASFFKRECPNAYAFSTDDKSSTFTCKASKYKINFGG